MSGSGPETGHGAPAAVVPERVGGDGTLREVVAALLDAGGDPPPTFVLPAGRGNSAYRHLYGDADWRAVARRLADGLVPAPVAVGELTSEPAVPERYFVLGFTAGLFRAVLAAAESLSALPVPGPLAYLLGTARALSTTDPFAVTIARNGDDGADSHDVCFDGEARLVAVGGGRYRGRAFDLLPRSRPDDDHLHVLVVEPVGLREGLALVRDAREGAHIDHPAVHYFEGDAFDVRAPGGMAPELDGTPLPTLRDARAEARPGALPIARPG